jgi:putative ABC transport system permease protein
MTPPKLPFFFIFLMAPADGRDEILGDLNERFLAIARRRGTRGATLWYWSQAWSAVVRFGARRLNLRLPIRSGPNRINGPQPRNRVEVMNSTFSDIRYAVRGLIKSPGFTAATVLTLALGIGANTAMFSAINSILVKPPAYEDPDRLIMGLSTYKSQMAGNVSAMDYFDFRDQNDVLESMAAIASFPLGVPVIGTGEPERVQSAIVTVNLFQTLGVDPQLGRHFVPEEESRDSDNVVLISHGYWQRDFGGESSVLGRTLILNGTPYAIIGVMPAGFNFLHEVDLWRPMQANADWTGARRFHNFFTVGRLKTDVTLEQAQAQMDVIARQLAVEYPESNKYYGLRLFGLHESLVFFVRPALLMLMGAVGLVLLIVCGNVASLLLARSLARRTEVAVRSALGATRSRLVRQFLAESTVLAVTGGALGLLFVQWSLATVRRMAPPELPGVANLGIDGVGLAFALGVSVLTGLLFGIVPALRSAKSDTSQELKASGRTTETGAGIRLRGSLVVAQVALSLVLLIGSGLLIRSFLSLRYVDSGFDSSNLLTAEITLPMTGDYEEPEQRIRFYESLMNDIAVLPGVEAVAASNRLPVKNRGGDVNVYAAERPPVTEGELRTALIRTVTPGYFETMRIPLMAGREFTPTDDGDAPRVVIVDESVAERYFPGENPLGRGLVVDVGTDEPWEIIGVAGYVRQNNLQEGDWNPTVYFPYKHGPRLTMRLAIRSNGEPLALVGGLRRALRALNRDIPLAAVETMDEVLAGSVTQPKMQAYLVGAFALVALLLAAIGLYGVLAYAVSQRIHEMGIRIALGANAGNVMRLVLRTGMGMVGIGLGIGLVAGFGLTRFLQSLLYQVAPTDPTTFIGVTVVLFVVGLAACFLPAWKAVKTDPLVALRVE